MVLLPDGGFLRTIWGPVDPSQSLFYRETVGKKLVKSLTPGLASSFYYLGTPIGAILYASDFEDRNFVDWKYLNSMGWKILEYGGNYGLGIQNPDPNAIPEIYLLPSDGWADYSVSTNVVFTSGQFE